MPPLAISNLELVDTCEPREGKVVVIMKMSACTRQISTRHLSLSLTEQIRLAVQLKGNENIVGKQAPQTSLIAAVCSGLQSKLHVIHVDSV